VAEGTSALFVPTSGAKDLERVAEETKYPYHDEQLAKLCEVFAG
jgi:hypothetical protein